MNLNKEQFDILFGRYRSKNPNFPASDAARKQFKLAIEYIERKFESDFINLFALSSSKEDTFEEHKSHWDFACQIFDASLPAQNNFKFDTNRAELEKIKVEQKIVHTSLISIHGMTRNQGLREKLIKGNLTKSEWLTDLDLQRMLELTGTQDKIHILTFDPQSIGTALHFEREKHTDGLPYSIPILLNKGSDASNQGSHWLAANITVDPTARTVSYTITDSMKLSASEEQAYKKLIEDAINYQEHNSPDLISFKGFPANEGWTLKRSDKDVVSQNQNDGFSCGYRALHNLFQIEGIVGDNEIAKDYKGIKGKDGGLLEDSSELVKAFYEAQLENLVIDASVYDAINHKQRKLFESDHDQKRIKNTAVQEILTLQNPSVTEDPSFLVNPAVSEAVNKLNGFSSVFSFPGISDPSLSATDFEQLFTQLQIKLDRLDINLKVLTLTPCNADMLDGLNAYCGLNAGIRVDKLKIDLDPSVNPEVFVAKLKLALNNLSENNLAELAISDKGNVLKEEHWLQIYNFVEKKQVPIAITLPEKFLNSAVQHQLDDVVSVNQRVKNQNELGKEQKERKALDIENKGIRKRPTLKDARAGINIDIELQQEQQVEVAVAVQKTRESNEEEVGFGEIHALDLDGMMKLFLSKGGLAISPEAQLISNSELKKNWHTWMGDIVYVEHNGVRYDPLKSDTVPQGREVIISDTRFGKISIEAIEQLMEHREQFRYGLNPDFLPPGFALVPDPGNSESLILHYDKSAAPASTDIAPQLQDKKYNKPPSADVFAEMISSLKPNDNARDAVLLKQWNAINSSNYSRDNTFEFRGQFSKLLLLNKDQLEQVFNLCNAEGTFNAKILHYIMENNQRTESLFKGNANRTEDNSVAFDSIVKLFNGSEDLAKSFIELSHHIATTVPDKNQHILLTLLADNPELKNQVESWASKLSFDDKQMNALLQVYTEYSSAGLSKLFDVWKDIDSDLLKQLNNTVFKKADSFVPLIKDEKMQVALKVLSGLSQDKSKYAWWSKLLEQHASAVGYDSLPELVSAFNSFTKKIEEMGLTFYPNVSFSEVKSMPTVLGRILTILENTAPADRKQQWKEITAISLEPNGAIREFTRSNLKVFVIPEMRVNPLEYNNTDYSAKGKWKTIAEQGNLVETRKEFYRFIAHQKDRLPLDFYREMDAKIVSSKCTDTEKAKLFALLADSTTGITNVELSSNLEESRQNWTHIVDTLNDIPLPSVLKLFESKIREQLVDRLYDLGNAPALPVLKKLLDLIGNALKIEGSVFNAKSELQEKSQRLNTTCYILEQVTQNWGDSIYTGMKFYTDDTYKEPGESIFYRHLDTAVALLNGPNGWAFDDKEYGRKILSLISTFGLANGDKEANQSTAFRIRTIFDAALMSSTSAVNTALYMLQSMDKNGPPPLTPDDLYQFISQFSNEYISSRDITKIQNMVKDRFENYFPDNYFKLLQAEGMPAEAKQVLNSKFSENERKFVEGLVSHYTEPGDSLQYLDVIKKLVVITRDLSKLERETFLQKLNSPAILNNTTINDLNQLLEGIKNSGSPNDFLFFLNKAEHFKGQTSVEGQVRGLMQKTQVYLNTILPSMEQMKSKVVSKMDSLNLVIDLLLTTNPDKLGSSPKIARPDDNDFLEIQKQLAVTVDAADPKLLETQINSFIEQVPGAKNLIALKNLQEHLQDLNKPEPVVVQPEQDKPSESNIVVKVIVGGAKAVVGGAKAIAGSIYNFFSGTTDAKTEVTPAAVIPAQPTQPVTVVIKKPKILDANLLAKASTELATIIEKRKQFDQVFVDLFKSINQAAEHYPGDKNTIINYLRHFLSNNYSSDEQIVFSWNNINLIKDAFIDLDDPDVVRSLCNHFSNDEGEFTHESLLKLLSSEEYSTFPKDEKKLFLSILTSLINNDKPCTLLELNDLMTRCKDEKTGPILLETLKNIYKSAPYPTLEQFQEWENKCPKDSDLAKHLADCYAQFDKEPCARESVNGFKLDFAKEQVAKMGGVTYSDKELESIDKEVKAVRNLSTDEIKNELLELRSKTKELSTERLVALSAELMYRTKGMPAVFDEKGKQKLGRSFEIHTTQYLAIHSMLKAGTHVTSEIGTGEGKSRIMMLMILCQYAQGKTVDFVTADVQLATRDYLSFRSLFQSLGAKTNIIYQNTPSNEYALDGINFSDAANLSLFRNKARSEGKAHQVIAENPDQRAMMLDEADRTYFDMSDTRFNYSAMADATIRDMPWAYEVLVGFFSQDNPEIMRLYQEDIDACNKLLIEYAYNKVGPENAKRLESVAQSQLESWQQSALTALVLELDKDFVIKPDIEIETAKGPLMVSEARLLIGNREDRSSKFSFGVHQCLHARLNMLKNKPDAAKPGDEKLIARLAECENQFFIDNEKQIIYSSTSKSMLDEYDQGTVCAVTGTAGSIREQEEAKALYGSSKDNEEMSFISVPRHRGLNRVDYPLYLAADKKSQFELFAQQIREARAANQPVAIICENDIESQAMMDYLKTVFPEDPSMVRISSQTSSTEEAEHIENHAGLPGMVTVSTGMIGRGTDIPLKDKAADRGLKVLVNYLPRERELNQIIGRAGRFGAEGDTRLILNKVDLKKQFGKTSLNDGFYTATEAYIKQQHAIMDRKAQVERMIKFTVADFRRDLTNNYFDQFFNEVATYQQPHLSTPWKKFFDETDKKWTETWQAIKGEMDSINPDVSVINKHLDNYQNIVQAKWNDLKQETSLMKLAGKTMDSPTDLLKSDVGALTLSEKSKAILAEFSPEKIAPLKTAVYDKYDPAHDGKAVLYTRPFEKLRAVFRGERSLFADFNAWMDNRGILFPNLRAWWNGHMTFGQLLFGGATKDSVVISEKGREITEQAVSKTTINGGPSAMVIGLGVKSVPTAKVEELEEENLNKLSSSVTVPKAEVRSILEQSGALTEHEDEAQHDAEVEPTKSFSR
ncbi:hypothetical protein [Legionella quateirensis]|uniref:Coiled-coil protein n=1 Tax=Legionella quateirensis TaxID=45072 RepID=A0A378KWA1_9GAMM|nr:hypothetical protein [Legionella quateirensis]KTD50967.1 coiled-coil protein [Legionella quateirensis]STY17787.1 coiled-coil protein [Legionella quateirensis]